MAVNYDGKKFYNIGPWWQIEETYHFVFFSIQSQFEIIINQSRNIIIYNLSQTISSFHCSHLEPPLTTLGPML